MTLPSLEEAWQQTAARTGLTGPEAGVVYQDLCRRYSEPGRAYHNLGHVAAMLETTSEFRGLVRDDVALRLSVWFHDAVYDSRRIDNEEKSAAYAMAALKGGACDPLRMRVMVLIGKTKTHEAPAGDSDCQILLDADLAVLGSSADDYDRYAGAIREEYASVPEADYRAGRRRVLESFLGRERLSHTAPLFEQYEQAARANLRREIECLTNPNNR